MPSLSARTAIGLLMLQACTVQAQEYSYDGNRWYEVEVSIFSNDYPQQGNTEIAVPDKLTANYLPRLQELQTRYSSFMVDFAGDEEQVPPVTENPDSRFQEADLVQETTLVEQAVLFGPVYSPAVKDGFHIADFSRDAYIDLDARAARFTAANRNLDNSPEHRVLWHKIWRQPMQGRAQTPAVFISGGDVRGAHTELEGSLRLSDNSGRVMLDVNVWLARFNFGTLLGDAPGDSPWKLPELPFPLPLADATDAINDSANPAAGVAAIAAPDWSLSEVWQLEQTRELGADEMYYLDNPALGVLIQIRPYVLPARLVAEDEQDF